MPEVSSTRSTIFSPHTVGNVARRRSTLRWLSRTVIRPFCGTRRSVMSTLAMIFSREMSADWTPWGTLSISCSTPSMRNRTRMSPSLGSRCRSEARLEIACSISELTYRTIGASSPAELRFDTPAASSVFNASPMEPRSLSWRLSRSISLRSSLRAAAIGRMTMPVAARMSSNATTSPGSLMATTSSLPFIAMPSTRCRRTSGSGILATAAASIG